VPVVMTRPVKNRREPRKRTTASDAARPVIITRYNQQEGVMSATKKTYTAPELDGRGSVISSTLGLGSAGSEPSNPTKKV